MAAGASAAAAAAIANAIKASGVLVRLEPEQFIKVLALTKEPLIVVAKGGFFGSKYQYLMSYKGLAFFTKSSTELRLPADAETVNANRISIPG
jgi:hypothetical protein